MWEFTVYGGSLKDVDNKGNPLLVVFKEKLSESRQKLLLAPVVRLLNTYYARAPPHNY
jgi:hypothetical protein